MYIIVQMHSIIKNAKYLIIIKLYCVINIYSIWSMKQISIQALFFKNSYKNLILHKIDDNQIQKNFSLSIMNIGNQNKISPIDNSYR